MADAEEARFQRFFKRELRADVEDLRLQKCRKTRVVTVIAGFFWVFAAIIFGTVLAGSGSGSKGDPLQGAIAIAALGFMIRYSLPGFLQTSLKLSFKQKIIAKIARFADPDIIYDSELYVAPLHAERSGLFGSWTGYWGSDLFQSHQEKTRFEFSRLRISASSYRVTKQVFAGLFFVAAFNKPISGLTLVVPDRVESALGWLAKKVQELDFTRPGNLVYLEDIDFEKHFAVYASDPVEARYVLSPALMRRLTDLREKHGIILGASIGDGMMRLALSGPDLHFEMPADWRKLNRDFCYERYRVIRMCLDLVEDLDLNTRIWGDSPR